MICATDQKDNFLKIPNFSQVSGKTHETIKKRVNLWNIDFLQNQF